MVLVSPDQLVRLVELQKLEIELHKNTKLLDQVDARVAALDANLKGFIAVIESKEEMVTELQQKYRAWESEVLDSGLKAQKSEEKLRAVKTNKEYQSGLKEIDDLKTKTASIEDSMILCLEQIEAVEGELRDAKSNYEREQQQLTREKEEILLEAGQTRKALEQLQRQRDAVGSQITGELLSIFKRVKSQQPDGRAIVRVQGAVCQGCHMNIPPQMYNELQREDSLKMCPSCERIIYWQRTDERSE